MLFWLALPFAHAATLTVSPDGGADHSTIGAAIDAAQSGDTISVWAGTYWECVDLGGKDIELIGADGMENTILRSDGSCEALILATSGEKWASVEDFTLQCTAERGVGVRDADLSLRNMVIAHCGDLDGRGGALFINASGVVLDSVELRDNQARQGGAIYVAEDGGIRVKDSAILDNRGDEEGGGIYLASGAELEMINTRFEDNVADIGGALFSADGAEIVIEGGDWVGNGARLGGALSVSGQADLAISGLGFQSNVAEEAGGAIMLEYIGDTVLVSECTFVDNQVERGVGGAISGGHGVDLRVEDSLFEGNQASNGGAIDNVEGARTRVEATSFVDNLAIESGGAIRVKGGTDQQFSLKVADSFFGGNQAGTYGAALASLGADTLWLEGSELIGNGGAYGGGALMLADGSDVRVAHNLFCGNEAGTGGAAWVARVQSDDHLWINNRFVDNSADSGGGALRVQESEGIILRNNTWVGNHAAESGGVLAVADVVGDFVNNAVAWTGAGDGLFGLDEEASDGLVVSYNAFFENTGTHTGGALGAPTAEEGNIEADPALLSWLDDGDCENDDLLPSPDSPLLDAGHPEVLDPTGGRSDIGAYGGAEAQWVDADGDGAFDRDDCDDTDPDLSPFHDEVCDGLDNTCDGVVDEDPVDGDVWYADADGDGFGDPAAAILACDEPAGHVVDNTDCDDTDALFHPGAPDEQGDGIDHACDGETGSSGPDVPPITGRLSLTGCAVAAPSGLGALAIGLISIFGRRRKTPFLETP